MTDKPRSIVKLFIANGPVIEHGSTREYHELRQEIAEAIANSKPVILISASDGMTIVPHDKILFCVVGRYEEKLIQKVPPLIVPKRGPNGS